MLSSQRPSTSTTNNYHHEDDQESEPVRDIHALTPPLPPPPAARARWETGSHSYSIGSEGTSSTENFTTMSREFNALVIAGSAIGTSSNSNINNVSDNNDGNNTLLARIGEDDDDDDDDVLEETNPLAIVPDNNPLDPEPGSNRRFVSTGQAEFGPDREVSLQRVKKEEVETKISAWQNAKIAKINNRFKREDAVINGWESEQVHKATSWMKKVERKLEEKRAKALEKMQNEVAKAHRKAEDKRASAEAKRGTKVARVLEITNLMRAVGRPPAKRSLF